MGAQGAFNSPKRRFPGPTVKWVDEGDHHPLRAPPAAAADDDDAERLRAIAAAARDGEVTTAWVRVHHLGLRPAVTAAPAAPAAADLRLGGVRVCAVRRGEFGAVQCSLERFRTVRRWSELL